MLWLQAVANQHRITFDFPNFKRKHAYNTRAPLQKDGYNCGIYLLIHAYSICLTGKAEPTAEWPLRDPSRWRMEIYRALAMGDLSLVDSGRLSNRGLITPDQPLARDLTPERATLSPGWAVSVSSPPDDYTWITEDESVLLVEESLRPPTCDNATLEEGTTPHQTLAIRVVIPNTHSPKP